jgi:hypothetical protein
MMSALRELQHALRDSLVGVRDDVAAAFIDDDRVGADERLAIYRTTSLGTLARALKLTYPAVERLVGAEFFAAAAQAFVRAHPARSALLDDYGDGFAAFVERLPATASIPYLGDVARLEWCVSRALHAEDAECLDLARLSESALAAEGCVRFVPQPSVSVLRATYPADAIWRAVLDADDAAMAAIDLAEGPVWLLVHRGAARLDVSRLREPAARFTEQLLSGQSLGKALEIVDEANASAVLAEHLRAGRFSAFTVDAPR